MMASNEIALDMQSLAHSEPLTVTSKEAGSIRVWLVDDDEETRSLMALLLCGEGGFDCTRQFFSADALLDALATEVPPDVILLDIQIGDENGLDAIRPIKLLAPSARVLMVTTVSDTFRKQQALRNGASDFLLKSYSIKEITSHIRQAVNQPASALARETTDGRFPDAETAGATSEFPPARSANSKPVITAGRCDRASATRPSRGRWRSTWWGYVANRLLRFWHDLEPGAGRTKGKITARTIP